MVNLEPPLYQAAGLGAAKDASGNLSGYCRRLLIEDLVKKGILTEEIMRLIMLEA